MSKNKRQIHKVKFLKGKIRITDYAVQIFPILGSRTAAKKAIAAGQLLVNKQLIDEYALVKKGDFIELNLPRIVKKLKVAIDLPIIYEDNALIIINKPAGIAVNGNRNKTVENAIIPLAKKSQAIDALPSPRAVHRIDVPTKGLVLLAKTKSALITLSKAFQKNEIQKTYYAVVHGKTPVKGQITNAIQGKRAVTHYERISIAPSQVFKQLSLLKLAPLTGRTHQLRIHLKNQGHLILGDKQYAENEKTILGKGLFLAACGLKFKHPNNLEVLDIKINPPSRFFKTLEREEKRFNELA